MKILIRRQDSEEIHLVLMFGLGMIGTSINNALLAQEFNMLTDISFDWDNAEQMARAYETIELTCKNLTDDTNRLSVVWSAGKSGFYSSEDETDQEYLIFQGLVNFVSMLRKRINPQGFGFHCVSSAGGLFEGQRVIKKSSDPTPLRPYGKLKKRQEDFLLDSFDNEELSIYRPSSVYGPMVKQSRHGLINNLVSNARNGRITVLDAHIMSLRDYVFAGDIGNFVGKRIRFELESPSDNPVYFLVSAKCSAIFEVFTKIKRILNLHAQFRYDDQFGNHKNITFSDNVLPTGWRPVPLDVGIRQFIIGREGKLSLRISSYWQ